MPLIAVVIIFLTGIVGGSYVSDHMSDIFPQPTMYLAPTKIPLPTSVPTKKSIYYQPTLIPPTQTPQQIKYRCQLGDQWIEFDSLDKCKQQQNKYNQAYLDTLDKLYERSKEALIWPTYAPLPTSAPLPTFELKQYPTMEPLPTIGYNPLPAKMTVCYWTHPTFDKSEYVCD